MIFPLKYALKGPFLIKQEFQSVQNMQIAIKSFNSNSSESLQNLAGHKLHETSKRDVVINYYSLFLKKKVASRLYSARLNV